MTALLIALASAWLTESVGLSSELGAFLAGVMLAETEYVHQVESDIQPFRDVLLGLFFVTVGVKLNTHVFIDHWMIVAGIASCLILVKTLIIYIIAHFINGYDRPTSLKTGLALSQGGEFGFVILSLNASQQILSEEMLAIIIASIFVSLAIAPLIIKKLDKITGLFFPKTRKSVQKKLPVIASHGYKDHVIICGYGRVGQHLALFLEQEDIAYIGIDLDPERLKEASCAKEPVFYGDATREETLLTAGLNSASLVVITFDDAHRARRMLKIIRNYNKTVPTLVRTRDDRFLSSLQQSGATEIIPEILEASLMMASHMLLLLGLEPNKVRRKISEIKGYRYQMLRSYYHSSEQTDIHETSFEDISFAHAIVIDQNAYAFGKSMKQLSKYLKVHIRSFTRKGVRSFEAPDENAIIEEGDIFVVEGSKIEIVEAEEYLLYSADEKA
jgi:CPA2 family monovalent cation:H+ antiporter-2